jgi:hypothetical protein
MPPSDLFSELEGRRYSVGGLESVRLAPVTDEVVAAHNGSHVTFVFLQSGKTRTLVPRGGRGVGVVCGRDDLGVLAWTDKGPRPGANVMQYSAPLESFELPGRQPSVCNWI